MLHYDFPLNARARYFLRVESLAKKIYFKTTEIKDDTHIYVALESLVDFVNLVANHNLKLELLQEINKAENYLKKHNDEQRLKLIEEYKKRIQLFEKRFEYIIRDFYIPGAMSQRSEIGPILACDLPIYHHWFNKNSEQKLADLKKWSTTVEPAFSCCIALLNLLRETGDGKKVSIGNGNLKQNLPATNPWQMIRISLPKNTPCFPEVSTGYQSVNIRFATLENEKIITFRGNVDVSINYYSF